jgi:cytochrome c biogenesis protein CcmG, thiol:disulfide interchange protein DsbE
VHEPTNPPTDERHVRGVPLRHIVVATAIALVVAVTAGLLVLLAADPADTPADAPSLTLERPREVVGAPAAVSYQTFDDEPANTGGYVGRPLVLNFFAEWCAPCVAEMPDFETVHQEAGDEIAFLGLSTLETADKALDLIERTGVTYDVARDAQGEAFEYFGGHSMPTTVFIDATGVVVEVHSGALTADQLRDRIDRLLR